MTSLNKYKHECRIYTIQLYKVKIEFTRRIQNDHLKDFLGNIQWSLFLEATFMASLSI